MALTPPTRTLACLAFVAAAVLPGGARAGVPVGLYPLQVEGLTDGERAEVQAVVESALLAAQSRGVLEPRSPLVVPGTCKPPITVGCVATVAKGGVVLYAKAKRRGAAVNVTVLFVDATGRRTRAVAFPVDLFIQNLRPANDAIATIEADLVSGALEESSPPPPPAAATPRAPAPEAASVAERAPPELTPSEPTVRPATPEPEHAPRPHAEPPPRAATPSAPIDLTPFPKAEPARPGRPAARPEPKEVAKARPTGDWQRTAGTWATGGGLAMLVAGAAVGLTGMRLADTLQDRFDRGALRPEDEHLYDDVDRYERIANLLFIGGGVVTAAGLTLHAIAPAGGGAGVAVAGSF